MTRDLARSLQQSDQMQPRHTALLLAFLLPIGNAAGAKFESGFETGSVDFPESWTVDDKGMSMISSERARTGKRALRIVDNSAGERGSSAWSHAISIKPGQRLRVSAWCFLQRASASEPLGMYLEFRDRAGKRIGNHWGQRTPLERDRWNLMIASRIAPAETAKALIWFHSFNATTMTGFIDDVTAVIESGEQPVDVGGWGGTRLDPDVKKDWPVGIRWNHGKSAAADYIFQSPRDLSEFKTLTFNAYSERATHSTFVLILASENPDTEGPDYYSTKVPVDFEGWKTIQIPLATLRTSRKPTGWQFIQSVKLRANGYDQIVNPDTEIVIDGMRFHP